ncbi:MAG: XdhC family protein [Acidobacteriota bacterium]
MTAAHERLPTDMPWLKNLLATIEDGASRGEPVAVVRVLDAASGKKATVTVSQGELFPPIADGKITEKIIAAVDSLMAKRGVADLVAATDQQGSAVRLAIEIIRPKFELVVFGAGHVGQAVALIGALTGYEVTVIDDREEFASRSRFPDPRIRLLVSDYASATETLELSASTAVVIVTRGHQYDEVCLKKVIRSNATYIGMIGSRRRVLSVFKKLAGEGVAEEDLQRVHAPIGLRIGAISPQEIGVSILAEIIDHLNNPGHEYKGERNAI